MLVHCRYRDSITSVINKLEWLDERHVSEFVAGSPLLTDGHHLNGSTIAGERERIA